MLIPFKDVPMRRLYVNPGLGVCGSVARFHLNEMLVPDSVAANPEGEVGDVLKVVPLFR